MNERVEGKIRLLKLVQVLRKEIDALPAKSGMMLRTVGISTDVFFEKYAGYVREAQELCDESFSIRFPEMESTTDFQRLIVNIGSLIGYLEADEEIIKMSELPTLTKRIEELERELSAIKKIR